MGFSSPCSTISQLYIVIDKKYNIKLHQVNFATCGIGTDCMGRCTSNSRTITDMMIQSFIKKLEEYIHRT